MIEPNAAMIEERWHRIQEGIAIPHIPEFPQIAFRKITRLDWLISKDIEKEEIINLTEQSKKLKEQGRTPFIDALDIPHILDDWAEQRGWNRTEIEEKYSLYRRRIVFHAPPELVRPSAKKFTDEELAELTPEMKEKYQKEEMERINNYLDWVEQNTTEEEKKIRSQFFTLLEKRRELENYSLQVLARNYAQVARMIMCSVHSETREPYFEALKGIKRGKTPEYRNAVDRAIEEWENMNVSNEAAEFMITKWRQWEEGNEKDFLFL